MSDLKNLFVSFFF